MCTQSDAIRELYSKQQLAVLHHTEMQKTIKDLLDQQSKVERIKNFPYPRQYATINTYFVWSFAALLPFCMVREFDRLNEGVSGIFVGNMVWFTVPFSMLICRVVEIELRETLRETDLPPLLRPTNQIIL